MNIDKSVKWHCGGLLQFNELLQNNLLAEIKPLLWRHTIVQSVDSVWDNDRGTRHSWNQNRRGRRPRRFSFTDDEFRGHYAT